MNLISRGLESSPCLLCSLCRQLTFYRQTKNCRLLALKAIVKAGDRFGRATPVSQLSFRLLPLPFQNSPHTAGMVLRTTSYKLCQVNSAGDDYWCPRFFAMYPRDRLWLAFLTKIHSSLVSLFLSPVCPPGLWWVLMLDARRYVLKGQECHMQ